jgi:peroxiredoxin Q/BCP
VRALLVGGTGFVSTLLARRLWADGHDVTVVSRGLRDAVLPADVERIAVDRCVAGALDAKLAGRSFDVVYDFHAHEANAPRQLFAILPSRARMGRYVLVSSGAVYRVPLSGPVTEDHPLEPRDAYGRGKLDAERGATACSRASGIPLTIVRPNETLGPRDSTGRRFLHLIQRAAQGIPIVVPGRLDVRVNWGYVEDLARLLALVARKPDAPDLAIYNGAGGATFTFGDYLAAIMGALGRSSPVRALHLTSEAFQCWEGFGQLEWHLNCFEDAIVSIDRARAELGFEPRTGIAGAVASTVRWLETESPQLLAEAPPDRERARRFEDQGELASLPPTPALPAGEGSLLGDRLDVPTEPPPPGPGDPFADRLGPLELALILPLCREPDALDRAALLQEAAHLARASGAASKEESLEALSTALEAVLAQGFATPLERDGIPAFRIAARGYTAALAAVARPPRDPASATPAALLLRFHALARAAYLTWVAEERPASEVIDPFALGIPFVVPSRDGANALPEGVLDLFASFEDFARYFHAAQDGSAVLARWKGALRLARARLEDEARELGRESARLGAEAASLLADLGTRSQLVTEIQVALTPRDPVSVLWVKRAELERRTLVEPRIALLGGLLAALAALEPVLDRASGRLRETLEPTPAPGPGDLAPELVAEGVSGPLRLSALRGRWVVLYFYPMDDTPGCTLESCRFRDDHALFRDAGAAILGVSTQGVGSHRAFTAKHALPFELVADPDGRIARAYGVLDAAHGWAERVTFLIDPAGRIARVFRVRAIERHASEVLAALRGKSVK